MLTISNRFLIVLGLAGLLLSGCGGGGGSAAKSNSPTQSGQNTTTPGTTAHFHVDVKTGQVSVVNGAGATANSRTIFAGTTIAFNTSVLTNLVGAAGTQEMGTRVMNVSLTNNSSLALGNPNGLNVEFSNFQNVGSFPDVRSLTNVATVASSAFNAPYGVAAAGNGNFYVADTFHNQIKFVSGGSVTLFAGNGVKGEVDGPASTAEFNLPIGIAFLNGNLIVADFGGNKIRQISPSGQVTTLVSSATFNGPWGVATDGTSNIFVAEKTGSDVKEISGVSVSTLAGGTGGNLDGVGSSARFYNPEGIAYSSGFLYVADNGNNSVRQVNVATGSVITIAGTGGAGHTDGTGNVATLAQPAGVTVLNGSVIFSENGSGGVSLRQITPLQGTSGSNSSAWQTSTIAGTGVAGNTDGVGTSAQFNNPCLISSDVSGNIYVADINNNSIREVTLSNGIFPVGVPTGATSSTELVELTNPTGQQDSASGTQTYPFVNYPGPLANGQTSASQPWAFVVPNGVNAFEFDVTVQASPNVLIGTGAQLGSGDPTEIVSTLAGSIQSQGSLSGATSQARFGYFLRILETPKGTFVSDDNNRTISLITSSGQVYTIAGGPGRTVQDGTGDVAGFLAPSQLAQDSNGNVYVADGQSIRVLVSNGGSSTVPVNWTVSTIAGQNGADGETNGLGTVARFNFIVGLAFDSVGNLFALDDYNNNIRLLTPTGGYVGSPYSWNVSLFAGSPTGTAGSANGTGTAALFNFPYSLTIDPFGNLYVADYENNQIRKITRDGVVSTLLSGLGYADGNIASAALKSPLAVACDSAGNVYFADQISAGYGGYLGDTVIRRITPGGTVSTVAGFSSGTVDGPGNVARFYLIYSLSVSPTGDIYVGDGSSVRVVQKEISVGANSKRK